MVELSASRASRSATRCSSSATRHRSDSKTAMRAACASGGTVFQSDSGIGSVGLIHSDYVLTVQKVRGVSAYVQPGSLAHSMADFLMAAIRAGFRLDHIGEHAPDAAFAARYPRAEKYIGYPMLVVLGLVAEHAGT